MRELAGLANVACKISGVLTEADHAGWREAEVIPYIAHAIDCFGFDRVMFGGDWPVCLLGVEQYGDWLTALKTVVKDRSEDHQKKLFHDNAVKFYGL